MAAHLVLLVADQSKDRFVRQNETIVMVYGLNNYNASNNDEDINTASATRTVYTTNDVIKKEDLDVEYEFLPASALIRHGYNAGTDVEIVACFHDKKSNSNSLRAPNIQITSQNNQV